MSLEESTFNTAQVLDNEIVKASDFTFAFDNLINNISRMTQMVLEANQDFVINGKVIPYQGMNVKISPIYGVCFSTGQNFGSTEEQVMEYGFGESTEGRVDIIQVKGEWVTYDNQQRAFNDPDTDTQTYQYVDTKKFLKPVFQIKTGEEGSSVAPEVDDGWVKLAEVVIRANNSTITEDDIKNITSDIAGLDNNGWTNQPSITYNIGYISDVNKRFREQHNEDGSHKEKVIGTKEMNIGIGSNALNSNVIPLGGSVSLPDATIPATDSILSLLNKIATFVINLFNSYLKNGAFNFNGELALSSLVDENNTLTKALKLGANGDGSAYLKVGNSTVLTITVDGKLVTNGYTASAANQLITKAVTDSISQTITELNRRLSQLEATTDITVYANGTLSAGRYTIDSITQIYAATTTNINLVGTQSVDNVELTDGVCVLVKNQTDKKENGLYQYSSSSAWSRLSSYDTPQEMIGKIWIVLNGTENGGRYFYMPKVNFVNIDEFGVDDIPIEEYFATHKAKPNRIIVRDKEGRAQVAAPVAENDIARKAEITALYGSAIPTQLGNAAVGTSSKFAREDHVHPAIFKVNDGACCFEFYTNELNFYGNNTNYRSWINYRGGTSSVYIGNGSGCASCYGDLYAKCVYANLSGTATNANYLGGYSYSQVRSGLMPTSGGTFTGTVYFPDKKYIDAGGAMNLCNSDIINVNLITFNDTSGYDEGLGFTRTNGNYDVLNMSDGYLQGYINTSLTDQKTASWSISPTGRFSGTASCADNAHCATFASDSCVAYCLYSSNVTETDNIIYKYKYNISNATAVAVCNKSMNNSYLVFPAGFSCPPIIVGTSASVCLYSSSDSTCVSRFYNSLKMIRIYNPS